jgi:hypothetical protein
LSILLGNGDGTFGPAATQKLSDRDGGDAILAADFGRGEIDLAVAHFSNNQIMILQGDGRGGFSATGNYMVGNGPEGMVAADFNKDGKIDIAINDLNDYGVAVLLSNGDGTFVPAANRANDTARPFGWAGFNYPAYITAGDLAGSGKPDILVTNLFDAGVTILRNKTITPVQLLSVVSRKTHGSAGTFDFDLPLSGNPGIECRSGGANGDYTLVFSFANPLANVTGASVTSGTGSVSSSNIDTNDAHKYVVNLTGVTNAQVITVSLTNANDAAGHSSAVVAASMGVLVGDVNGNGLVNSTDTSLVQSQSGQAVSLSNLRMDVNANGLINSTDASIVQSKSGTGLP